MTEKFGKTEKKRESKAQQKSLLAFVKLTKPERPQSLAFQKLTKPISTSVNQTSTTDAVQNPETAKTDQQKALE